MTNISHFKLNTGEEVICTVDGYDAGYAMVSYPLQVLYTQTARGNTQVRLLPWVVSAKFGQASININSLVAEFIPGSAIMRNYHKTVKQFLADDDEGQTHSTPLTRRGDVILQ